MNRRTLAAAGLAIALGLSAGCVSLPADGPVRAGPVIDQEATENDPFFDPPAPGIGDSPAEIVRDFLDSMTANPLTTRVARQYLTEDASSSWNPEARTVIYGSVGLSVDNDLVTTKLGAAVELGGRGEWLGAPAGGTVSHRLDLVREDGEWRISNPLNALIVPESYFENRFQQYSLYFFDKSAQILVPEPVYLPIGEATPTLLVRGLLRGPDQDLLGATRTFIPASTQIDLSVPVTQAGVAEVPLSDDVLDLSAGDLRMASAQLVSTLGQVTGVRAVRLTVDGSPLDVEGVGTQQDVGSWPDFDPRVIWASEELFGIREGHVVTLVGNEERRISGLFGSEAVGIRGIAVDLAAERVAAVNSDGTTVTVAPRGRESGEVPSPAAAGVIYEGGTDVLRPSWDLYGQVWLVDNTRRGAVLSVVRDGTTTTITAPGISGRPVKAFELSRDGTRLVAVVSTAEGDRLVLSRVMRGENGSVRRVAPASLLPVGAFELDEIRDLDWRTPETVALLSGPNTGLSQVIITRIDGSSALGDVASNPEIFRSEAHRIVTSPAEGAPLFVGTNRGQLFELASDGRWTGTGIQTGLLSPTFVG